MKKRKKGKEIILDSLAYLFGSAFFAVSVNLFTAPNNIAPGGILGLSTMIHSLFRLPIGGMILALNVPLIVMAVLKNGWGFMTRTLIGTGVTSVAIDLGALFLPAYTGDRILAALFGGVFAGIGLALIFMRGATTGGTDLVARLLQKKLSHIPMGRLMLGIDLIIVSVSAVVYRSIESALYAVITIFVTSTLLDSILYGTGSNNGKMLFIISKKNEEIARAILEEMERGVTKLQSTGGYSKVPGEVLLCAVRRQEITKIKRIIRTIDPGVFIITGEAGDIMGEGFGQSV